MHEHDIGRDNACSLGEKRRQESDTCEQDTQIVYIHVGFS